MAQSSSETSSKKPLSRGLNLAGTLLVVSVLGWVVWHFREVFALMSQAQFRAPDFSLILRAPFAVQLHLVTACLALLIGIVLLSGVKGNRLHRVLGWTWAISMMTTAISSLFIRTINDGNFSFIHLLSGLTIISLPMAVHAARQHKVGEHRRAMIGMFIGGLVVAGLLSFMPGRMMWNIFFG